MSGLTPARIAAAVFLAAVLARVGVSLEHAGIAIAGSALALATLAARRRPVAPTPGLSFIVLASGALLGYLALGDVLDPASWGGRFPLGAGLVLGIGALLTWVLAAHTPARAGQLGEGATQTLLVGGLCLLALLPLPPHAPSWAPALLPAGMALGVVTLVAAHGAGTVRLMLALPVLLTAPPLAAVLSDAPRPLVRALWKLAPDPAETRIGYDPLQPLRALAFLSPSDRPVLRVRASGAVPHYLVGNRLHRLDGAQYTWSAAPAPQITADGQDAGTDWYRLGAGTARGGFSAELVGQGNTLFLPPDALGVGVREGGVQAGQHGVLEARFADGAPRRYAVRTGVVPQGDDGADFLALPPFWDAELDAAARALAGATPAGTAQAVGAHLRGRSYALDTRLDPRRPFHDFFLNARPAYCFWYATGAVLALRANGVPARVVSGYLVSERLDGDTFIVRERDAHAWAEWQDARGRWHTLDPTPPDYSAFLADHRAGTWRRTLDRMAAAWSALRARFTLGDAAQNGLMVAGAAVLAFLFVREYRRLRAAPPPVGRADARVTRLWRRFVRRARLGDEPAWTCAQYAAALPAHWSPARRDAARAFLDAYGPVRFAPPRSGALMALELALRRFEKTP